MIPMTTANASIQDSVNHMRDVAADELVFAARRAELKSVVAEIEHSELGGEFIPGSFEMARDGLGFNARVRNAFGYRFRSFKRGDIVSFDQHGEII